MGSISAYGVNLALQRWTKFFTNETLSFGAGFNSVVAMLFTLGAGCDGAFIVFIASRRVHAGSSCESRLVAPHTSVRHVSRLPTAHVPNYH